MIERTLLVENVDAVLVGVDHKGELHWIGTDPDQMRDLMHHFGQPPNLHWYRVSLDHDMIYPAANGTPKYNFNPYGVGLRKRDTRHVKNFVENLRKVRA